MTATDHWRRVERRGPDECWPYKGPHTPKNYGWLRWHGRNLHAHRWAWIQTHGYDPKGQIVCHSCDNPICCNPRHLWLGTVADNNHDCDRKGRRTPNKGEENGRAQLTAGEVRAARKLYESGELSQRALARAYGVSRGAMRDLLLRRSWQHVR